MALTCSITIIITGVEDLKTFHENFKVSCSWNSSFHFVVVVVVVVLFFMVTIMKDEMHIGEQNYTKVTSELVCVILAYMEYIHMYCSIYQKQ